MSLTEEEVYKASFEATNMVRLQDRKAAGLNPSLPFSTSVLFLSQLSCLGNGDCNS